MKSRKTKPTIIAAVVAGMGMSGTASAQDSFLESIGITLQGGIEYERKDNTNYGFGNQTDKSTALQLAKVDLAFPQGFKFFYGVKRVHYWGNAEGGYDRKGLKHEVLAGRNFAIGSAGFTGGLFYNAVLEATKKDVNGQSGFDERTLDQRIRPTLSYWSNAGNWGFYSQLELIDVDTDNEVFWNPERYKLRKRGRAWLIEPYTKLGSWRIGTELYYQKLDDNTDVGSTRTQEDTYTEKYVEPKISYSFEEAGVLTIRMRFADKETKLTGGAWANPGDRFFSNVRKLTVGYEQNVGSWQLMGRYQRTWETEKSNASFATGRQKDLDQEKYELYATYRF